MKTRNEILNKIKELEENEKIASIGESILLSHEIYMLKWVLNEEDKWLEDFMQRKYQKTYE